VTTAAQRYRELAARVDAFFEKVRARHGADLACGRGCDACCRVRPSVTRVEADEVRAFVAAMPAAERAILADRAARASTDRCAALEADGACTVYDARPLVCRSHGLPIRLRDEPRLLPIVSACEKNFVRRGPDAADDDCILDQATLSTILHAVDAAHARELGLPPGERVDLAEALIDGARAR
jgi:hypothetical protein